MLRSCCTAAALLAATALGIVADRSWAVEPDPRSEPIPVLDTINTCKSLVVRLKFNSYTEVSLVSATVIRGCPPERVGGPPLIGLKLTSAGGCDIDTIPAWHPLWRFANSRESERLEILPEGEARFVLPFYRHARTLHVIDIPKDRELIAVSLQDAIKSHCQAHPGDMDCGPAVNLSARAGLIYSLLDFPTRVMAGQDLPQRTARFCATASTTDTTGTGTPPIGGGIIDVVLVPVSSSFDLLPSTDKPEASKVESLGSPSVILSKKTSTVPRLKSGKTRDQQLDLGVPRSASPGWYCVKIRSRAGEKNRQILEEQGNCQLVEVVPPAKSGQKAR